jgi:hypothetical protein
VGWQTSTTKPQGGLVSELCEVVETDESGVENDPALGVVIEAAGTPGRPRLTGVVPSSGLSGVSSDIGSLPTQRVA